MCQLVEWLTVYVVLFGVITNNGYNKQIWPVCYNWVLIFENSSGSNCINYILKLCIESKEFSLFVFFSKTYTFKSFDIWFVDGFNDVIVDVIFAVRLVVDVPERSARSRRTDDADEVTHAHDRKTERQKQKSFEESCTQILSTFLRHFLQQSNGHLWIMDNLYITTTC